MFRVTRFFVLCLSLSLGIISCARNSLQQKSSEPQVLSLEAPTRMTLSVSENRIGLTWVDNSTNEAGFILERSTDGVEFSQLGAVGKNVTSFVDSGLVSNTTYFYRGLAFQGSVRSLPSNIQSVLFVSPVVVTIPSAPTNLVATANSDRQVSLSWTDNSNNENGFSIERKIGTDPFVQINGFIAANATTFVDNALTASTNYFYRVRAQNSAGNSDYTLIASAVTFAPPIVAPVAPTALTASVLSHTSIQLTWVDNSTNEDAFKVERSLDGVVFSPLPTLGAGIITFTDSGLQSAQSYSYRVKASNSAGDSSPSNIISAITHPDPATLVPPAPTALRASVVSDTQITLHWNDTSLDEAGFNLYQKGPNEDDFSLIASPLTNATTFELTGLTRGASYYYYVTAHNSHGESPASNEIAVVPLLPPSAPSGLVVTALSNRQIKVEWADNSSNEDGFKIERANSATGEFTQVGVVTFNTLMLTDSGLSGGTPYFYQVRAYNGAGASAYTSVGTTSTLPNPPATPTSVTGEGVSDSQIRISWVHDGVAVSGFELEQSPAAIGPYAKVGDTLPAADRTKTITGLAHSTQFFFRIRSVNAGGYSEYVSTTATTNTPNQPAAPNTLNALAISDTRIELTWDHNAMNVSGFELDKAEGSGSFVKMDIPIGPTLRRLELTALTPDTNYQFRLRAVNAGVLSVNSATASARTFAAVGPGVPNGLRVTAVTETSVTLAWEDNTENETGFLIQRSASSTFTSPTNINVPVNSSRAASYTVTNLINNTTNHFRVKAVIGTLSSGYSNATNALTNQTAPAVPGTFVATLKDPTVLPANYISGKRVELSWTDVAGNDGYKIEQSSDGIVYAPIGTAAANAVLFVVENLAEDSEFWFRIRAYNRVDSAWATTGPVRTVPSAPTRLGLTSQRNSATSITLNWLDSSRNETKFVVERFDGTATTAVVTDVDANLGSHTISTLVVGTKYRFRVRAKLTVGTRTFYSGYSNEIGITPAAIAVAAPSGLSITVLEGNRVRLSWYDNSTNETGFNLAQQVGATGAFSPVIRADATALSEELTLSSTDFNAFKVRSVNGTGASEYSSIVSVDF